mmetsp:Transcript_15357/g.30316  ORF Transcript_15357/g.30316 Transcript_15357/m.30316 type:complete len:242 (-) Transcript_15357:631-1356(-)
MRRSTAAVDSRSPTPSRPHSRCRPAKADFDLPNLGTPTFGTPTASTPKFGRPTAPATFCCELCPNPQIGGILNIANGIEEKLGLAEDGLNVPSLREDLVGPPSEAFALCHDLLDLIGIDILVILVVQESRMQPLPVEYGVDGVIDDNVVVVPCAVAGSPPSPLIGSLKLFRIQPLELLLDKALVLQPHVRRADRPPRRLVPVVQPQRQQLGHHRHPIVVHVCPGEAHKGLWLRQDRRRVHD